MVDSSGSIYYTVASGTIFRFENGQSTPLSNVATEGIGNSGLLGVALIDDDTAVIHYTTPNQTYDILSRVDLRTGQETGNVRLTPGEYAAVVGRTSGILKEKYP